MVVAEFDDSALIKFFGQHGYGVFCTPTTIEEHVLKLYKVTVIGRTDEGKERFHAVLSERKIKHPAVKKVMDIAEMLF